MFCVCNHEEEKQTDFEEGLAEARAKFLELTEKLGAVEGEKAFDWWRLNKMMETDASV